MISVAGNQAIDEIGERFDHWDREDSRKKPPSPQPREQREKGIEPLLNNPIRLNQERHVRAARSVGSAQRALRLLALIRNQPNRRGFVLSSQSFKSLLCRHTETALPIVDQETASRCRATVVGHRRTPHTLLSQALAEDKRPQYSPTMPYRFHLAIVLAGLGLIGLGTLLLTHSPAASAPTKVTWTVYLVLLPIGLIGPVWMAWRWSAMACVVYGTIGLALDLATLVSIATHPDGEMLPVALSSLSGFANFFLIVLGGRSFLHLSLALSPPGSRPPNLPPPS